MKTVYYSQAGEDKFLEKLLPDKGFFVDIGAYDGLKFSNTKRFYDKGWSGLAVEGTLKYFRALMVNMPSPNVVKIPRMIQPQELDLLLKIYNVNTDYDLLSIDIDSFDYELWENSNIYFPKYVIIEVKSPLVAKNTKELGKRRGYELIWDKANYIFEKC